MSFPRHCLVFVRAAPWLFLSESSGISALFQQAVPQGTEKRGRELSTTSASSRPKRKKRRRAPWVLLCLILLLVFLFGVNRWQIRVTPDGPSEVTIEYGKQSYHDRGAEAHLTGSLLSMVSIPVQVSVHGSVDNFTVGTYPVTYRASLLLWKGKAVRRVHVVDTQAPVITLRTEKDHYTLPGHPYEEEGYTAEDNYDGDLTDRVKSEERDGVVHYSVRDSSGNEGTAERKIVYDDRTAPVLSFTRPGNITLFAGSDWKDEYHATDDVLGDCTDRVKVEGSVDLHTPGTYTLHYSVTDDYGNTATAQRTVTVRSLKQNISSYDESQYSKIIYLTFDDGPGPYTSHLLDILAAHGAKATFFVTGQDSAYFDCIGRAAREGHAIGAHSYSHQYQSVYASDDAFWADIDRIEQVIAAQTGSGSNLLRFPGGSSNEISRQYNSGIMSRLTQEAGERGFVYADWNVDSNDAGGATTSEAVLQNLESGVAGNHISMVLCHDIHPWTVNAMSAFLDWGIANGYTFLPVNAGSTQIHHPVNN